MALGACGGSSLSQEDAGKVYAAASVAASQAMVAVSQALAQNQADTAGDAITWDGENFTISNLEVSNSQGSGTAVVNGSGTKTSWNLTITFQDWESQGITLNGELTWEITANSSGSPESLSYKGSLTVSGSVSGDVEFDLTWTAPSCVEGNIGGVEFNQGC